MASQTDIANMALGHLGVSTEIPDFTDRSQNAAAMRRFYDEARDVTLRAFPWPFATRSGALALVAENPTSEWCYSYRYPSGCLDFRRILSGTGNRRVSHACAPKFRIASDDAGELIYTDQPDAEGEWTALVTDTERYPPDFRVALSYYLAFLAAPRIVGRDEGKLGPRAFEAFRLTIAQAEIRAANEELRDEPPESDFIAVRG